MDAGRTSHLTTHLFFNVEDLLWIADTSNSELHVLLNLQMMFISFSPQVIIQGFRSYRDQTVVEPFSPRHNVIGRYQLDQLQLPYILCAESLFCLNALIAFYAKDNWNLSSLKWLVGRHMILYILVQQTLGKLFGFYRTSNEFSWF